MASWQILISGLAGGGFLLLAFLFVYFLSSSLRLWRKQALVVEQNAKAHSWPLVARFSESLESDTPQPPASDANPAPLPVPGLNWIWLGILLVAVVIGIWAELSLIDLLQEDANADILWPILGFIIAGVLFAFSCRRVEGPSFEALFKAILPVRVAPPAALWLTNIALSVVLLNSISLSVGVDLPNSTNYLLFGGWLVNILLFCWNVIQLAQVSLPSREAVTQWWRVHRLEVLLLALIGLAALLIRLIGLETYPYAFTNDEGEVGSEALNILSGRKSAFFSTGWAGQSMAVFLPVAFFVKLLGNTALAVRLFSALLGTLSVIFLYLLAREAFDRPVAFFAACLLAALPWHVHFSRMGTMNVSDSFFSAGLLWLTYRALRRGNYADYLPIGLMTGLCIYGYVGNRLIPAMVIGVLAYAALRQRDYLRAHFRHLAIVVLGFFIVASPMLFSYSFNTDEFMGRLNEESLLTNNRLEEQAANLGMKPSDFVLKQLQDSSTVFIATPGLGQFFDTPQPYLTWWTAVFFMLGLAYAVWHFKQVRYILLLGWFWAPVIIGGALTQLPPANQRMLSAAPALALIAALGLWKFAQSAQQATRLPVRWLAVALCVLVVGFTTLQDINFYFVGQFRTDHRFEVAGNEFSYEVGMRARALGPNYQLFVIGQPDIYADFANFHYLAPDSNVADFNLINPETIANLARGHGMFFASIPSRVNELRLIEQQLPGGEWIEVPRHTQEGISYYAYLLPGMSTMP